MKVELPLFTRASDLQSLDKCSLQYLLEKAFEPELDDMGYFILGTAGHLGIEKIIADELDLWHGIQVAKDYIAQALHDAEQDGRVVRWTKKRSKENVYTDVERILFKWWDKVHPYSPNRLARYKEFQWPPTVEYVIDVEFEGYRLHTTTDAIFEHKYGDFIALVDWKTGATAKAKDIQLWTYTFGLRRDPEWQGLGIEAWFHHADHNKMQEMGDYPGDKYVAEWIAEIQRRKGGPFLASPDWWCNYCRVKDKCPVWGEGFDISQLEISYNPDPEDYYGETRLTSKRKSDRV